jgi:hypothetical protein
MRYILIVLALFIYSSSWSQCVIDTSITHNVPGIYPDSATGLPHALVGVAYSTVIQVHVKPDTVFAGSTGIIISVKIDSVTGLPPGFTFSCTPSNCIFPGGGDGCLLLSGSAPPINLVGSYPIIVHMTVSGTLSGVPLSVPDQNNDYVIMIDSTTGISTVERANFSIGQNLPNPANENTIIPVTLIQPDEITLSVSNLIGKKVISQTYNLQRGKTNIAVDLHGLQAGIYLYTITNGKTTVTRRMIISNN